MPRSSGPCSSRRVPTAIARVVSDPWHTPLRVRERKDEERIRTEGRWPPDEARDGDGACRRGHPCQRAVRRRYGRAARIMDQLEEAGILGPSEGAKGREVLIGMEQIDEYS